MQMIKSHFIVAITIFILKVSGAKAACYWNGDVCLIYCINMDAASIMEPIENLYAERPACYDQLTLRLRTLSYPNNTIDSYWFSADIKAVELEVYFNEVQSLSADAFNADAFRTLKKLTFENFRVPLIVNETFNGLDALEIIDIKGAGSVSRIETGVLDSLTELQEFIFEQSLSNNPELNINGFTGSGVLPKLEYVKIRYNLANSIKKSTFIGLRNVKRLDLSSCQIISIEDNSFDPMSETIEELNLSGNALTTVSYGVFSMALPNIKIINVNGNSWDCVCDLMAFRLFIEQYEENFIGHDCSSPTHCRISNIVESDCFDTCEIPSTTTSATTTTISETTIPIVSTENTFPTTIEPTTNESNDTTDLTTSETTTPSESNLIVECPDMSISDTISIERPIGYMTISENENGEANLHIETDEDVNSLVVIRLDEMEKSGGNTDAINCLSRSDVSAIPITDVKNGVIYSYCLMRKTSTSVSPLDCITYIKRQGAMVGEMVEVWLPDSSKTLAISLAVVSLILSCFLGMIITFCLMKCCYFCKHNNHQPSRMVNEPREAFSHDAERITTDKPSNVHNRNSTQTLSISGQNDALKYRSFTETTPKLSEESSYPYYATVEEKPKL